MEAIDNAERDRREQMLADVRHSTAMEGGDSGPDAKAIQDAWARGEITLDEMIERTRKLTGAE